VCSMRVVFAAAHESVYGSTKRTCHDVRLMSAKRTKADIDPAALTYRDFMSTRPSESGLSFANS
jgi:hypothetical protein